MLDDANKLTKANAKFCETGNCVDEVLLEDLQQIVDVYC